MKDLKKLSLNDEINREAEQIENEVLERKDLDDIQVSEDMETSLFNKIQEYEFDKREKKVHYRRKKRYLIFALAAVMVLACGSVMTGVGSKSYWKVLWDRINGDGTSAIINVEDMDSQKSEDIDEINVYKEINQTFGIAAVRMMYMPESMVLERYVIDEGQRKALLYYQYNDEIIRYNIYMNDDDSSSGQKELDDLTDEYDLEISEDVIVHVDEYDISQTNMHRYIGEFEYKDVHYQLKGIMEKEEFEKILRNLQFL